MGDIKLDIKDADLIMLDSDILSENVLERNLNTLHREKQNINEKNEIYMRIKRIYDIVLSFLALIVLSPVYLIIGLAIKIDSKGPAIFKHKRIGKNGEIIEIYKFRTMINNAESMIKNFNEDQIKEYKRNYKLSKDYRITKAGSFLRKTSLDELPQILNILKGELSIIGPRPVIEEELEKYGENKEKFLSITPGLTGYWQANGRSCKSYEERMQMELYYIDNISPMLDTKIFFKTIESVIKGKGAM